MIMNLVVIAFTAGLAYLWLTRGAFNSFLHMICTIVAGAIAFAAWEPLAYILLDVLPSTGFLGATQGMAWSIALVAPFALSLFLLRLLTDKLVGANLQFSGAVDSAGGLIFGGVAAVLTVGILTLGVSFGRANSSFFGYQPLWYNQDRQAGLGSLILEDSLWLPADKLAASFYSSVSVGPFASNRPLARFYPELHAAGFAARISAEDGIGRNILTPSDFVVENAYTVGDTSSGTPRTDLLVDIRSDIPQTFTDINGEPIQSGYLAGYIIRFDAGAKEESDRGAGPVVVSNGQIRLLVETQNGETTNRFPVAVISQASAGEQVYGRWRYDGENVHIASVGGAASVPMAFEFMLEPSESPVALYVKNVRVNLDAAGIEPQTAYDTVAARDSVVTDGSILRGVAGSSESTLDTSEAVIADGSQVQNTVSLGEIASTQTMRRFFTLAGDNNAVTSGEGQFDNSEIGRQNVPQQSNLQVKDFAVARDQSMIQIPAGLTDVANILGPVARLQPGDATIRLIDSNGIDYPAVGFVYRDRRIWQARYTPQAPLDGSADLPSLSTSRDDQDLKLVFIVSKGIEIEHLAIGDKVIVSYEPAVTVSDR